MSKPKTTRNPVVNAVGEAFDNSTLKTLFFPQVWTRLIRSEKGPYWLGIAVMSDLLYWHRPRQLKQREELAGGQSFDYGPKFAATKYHLNVTDTARRLGVERAAVSKAVCRLEKAGLVECDRVTLKAKTKVYATPTAYALELLFPAQEDQLADAIERQTECLDPDSPKFGKISDKLFKSLTAPLNGRPFPNGTHTVPPGNDPRSTRKQERFHQETGGVPNAYTYESSNTKSSAKNSKQEFVYTAQAQACSPAASAAVQRPALVRAAALASQGISIQDMLGREQVLQAFLAGHRSIDPAKRPRPVMTMEESQRANGHDGHAPGHSASAQQPHNGDNGQKAPKHRAEQFQLFPQDKPALPLPLAGSHHAQEQENARLALRAKRAAKEKRKQENEAQYAKDHPASELEEQEKHRFQYELAPRERKAAIRWAREELNLVPINDHGPVKAKVLKKLERLLAWDAEIQAQSRS